MLRDRQQLDMGEPHVGDVGDELLRQLVIGQEGVIPLAPPRAEMHFVDRHGAAPGIGIRPPGDVSLVAPREVVRARHDRSSRWPHLAAKAEGIRLEWCKIAARADDLVFVDGSFPEARRENLPNAAIHPLAHGVAAPVPFIEVAHDGDALGLRRPNGEQNAIHAFVGDRMRAQAFIKPLMRPFDKQVIIERTENRAESIGIKKFPLPAFFLGAQAVGEAVLYTGDQGFEEIAIAAPFEVQDRVNRLNQGL